MNLEQLRLLVEKLRHLQHRLVLAESCTGGLVAARLTSIAGVSEIFCGSMVTYREATKREWLAISSADLQAFTAVSREVTREMGRAVLTATPEASIAAAVTGHLGPNAPGGFDGTIFVAIIRREIAANGDPLLVERKFSLAGADRETRQAEAADFVLGLIDEVYESPPS